MEKIDYKKKLKDLYCPSNKVINIIDVPVLNFLTIESNGKTYNEVEFKEASEALIRLSYTIKFIIKGNNLGIDYISMPLESLWWNDAKRAFNIEDKINSFWELCIMQPEFVNESIIEKGIEKTKKKKEMPYLDKIKFRSTCEGISIQMMHVGPYEEENKTLDKLQAYIDVNSYEIEGKCHEIYLGDPRRAKPENLKTILRQPIKKIVLN